MGKYTRPVKPQGLMPEELLFGPRSEWYAAGLADIVDIQDPDIRYIIDAIRLMREAGFDMLNPEMLRLAVVAGRRRASSSPDDHDIDNHVTQLRKWGTYPGRWGARSGDAILYYARVGNRVKIGWTANLKQRMNNISPEELLATEPGGPLEEAARHQQFGKLRVAGEWFRYEGALVEHVSMLRLCA